MNLRRVLPALLMLMGVVLLAYVSLQYGTMYREQRRLAQQWEKQSRAPSSSRPPSSDGLTRLTIPKINLQAIVVEGTSRRQLLIGPGHIKKTPEPGEQGNVVVTGHRDTFFRHIFELSRGDAILIERDGETYEYEVTGKKIVEPEDVSVLRPTRDARLTLITCYPTYFIGPAPERLVVFSRLIEHKRAGEGQFSPASAPSGGSH